MSKNIFFIFLNAFIYNKLKNHNVQLYFIKNLFILKTLIIFIAKLMRIIYSLLFLFIFYPYNPYF